MSDLYRGRDLGGLPTTASSDNIFWQTTHMEEYAATTTLVRHLQNKFPCSSVALSATGAEAADAAPRLLPPRYSGGSNRKRALREEPVRLIGRTSA